ncbi:MAG: asparagine synthase (glutamine-hydrolyzing) [Acidimicrobiia bacterium]
MCGVTGFLDLRNERRGDDMSALVARMADAIRYRGPDAHGTWVDPEAGIALGHRRLSIVDLSEAGAQPMLSASERFVLSYNGEIYNAEEIAADLAAGGHSFRGHSDTEVLIEAIAQWGVETTLARCNGMFAFALWDRSERRLTLARDRLGEKPMYYGWFGSVLVFGSELKALRVHPAFDPELDRAALVDYFRFNCVPAPSSIFASVRKLPPATILHVDAGAADPTAAVPVPYWSVEEACATSALPRDDAAAIDAVEELLRDATRIRMRSDVPLGAFLSGGIDSALIVSLMQAQNSTPVRTFTIGTTERTHDESGRAAAVARHRGTEHTELVVTPQEAQAVIPRMPEVFDEPFADSSQVPTLLVAQLARRDVTVSLSGDGGDEVFGGYNRYRWVPTLSRRLGRIPLGLRRSTARTLLRVPPRTWDRMAAPLPDRVRPSIPGTKVTKFASIAALDSPEAMYRRLVVHWDDPESIVVDAPASIASDDLHWPVGDPANLMMRDDMRTYLPDDILTKLDRTTMSVSLEGRIPLLDPRLIELVGGAPVSMKIRDGSSKWLLRQVLARYVPEKVFDAPKSGFGVPIGEWLRGPLRPWAEDLLSADRLRRDGNLHVQRVRELWARHLSGKDDWGYHLWDVLMFEAWREEWTTTSE